MTRRTVKPKPSDDEVTPVERSPIEKVTPVRAGVAYDPCLVCGTNRSHLRGTEACPVDGFVPRGAARGGE